MNTITVAWVYAACREVIHPYLTSTIFRLNDELAQYFRLLNRNSDFISKRPLILLINVVFPYPRILFIKCVFSVPTTHRSYEERNIFTSNIHGSSGSQMS
jgi:hypothetical protein